MGTWEQGQEVNKGNKDERGNRGTGGRGTGVTGGTEEQGQQGEQGELLFKEVYCYACSQSLRTKGSQKIGRNFGQNF